MDVIQCLRGEIYFVNLGDGYPNEKFLGKRLCVITQNNKGNKYSPTTIIFPLAHEKEIETLNPLSLKMLLDKDKYHFKSNYYILFDYVKTISKSRFIKYINKLSNEDMREFNYYANSSMRKYHPIELKLKEISEQINFEKNILKDYPNDLKKLKDLRECEFKSICEKYNLNYESYRNKFPF